MAEPGEAGLIGFAILVAGIVGKILVTKAKQSAAFRAEVAKADAIQVGHVIDDRRQLLEDYRRQVEELRAEARLRATELEQHRQQRLVQDVALRDLTAQLANAMSRLQYAEEKGRQLFELNTIYRSELAKPRTAQRAVMDPPRRSTDPGTEGPTGDLSGPTPMARFGRKK